MPTPRLEPGDELSRDDFERRYSAMPDVKKAELIEGIVYMASPANIKRHGEPEMDLGVWMGMYKIKTPGIGGGHNSTVRLDLKNEPQPDLLLYIWPECGGRARLNDGYLEGGPELIAEVSASSVSIDMNAKFRSYHRNEVQEYLVWRVDDQAVDWFCLQDSEYVRIEPDAAGVLKSAALPGLWLDAPALIRGDMEAVLALLQTALADASHREFVETLAQRRAKQ
jgi:hypothetical protein